MKNWPTVVADYQVRGLLGQGSCGPVYLAVDTRTQQTVALKEFLVTPQLAQLFHRELALLFTLKHPNIIGCQDLVYGQSSRNYLVLEYANAGSLRDQLNKRGTLPEEEALAMMVELALGLEHAHEQGIVHRDLKPENVLCTGDLELGPLCYKIADLGIASPAHRLGAHVAGSPAYMAPEQFYDQASFESDFYALGIILYEALSGSLPYLGSVEELCCAHREQTPDESILQGYRCLPLIRRLLSKDPSQRPSTAREISRICLRLLGRLEIKSQRSAHQQKTESPLEDADFSLQLKKESPGGLQLFTPCPYQRDEVWVRDGKASDVVRGARFHTSFLPDSVRAVAPAQPDERHALYATAHELCRYDCETGKTRKLFALPFGITALARLPGSESLALLSEQRVEVVDRQGRRQWSRECPNFGLQAQMAVSDETALLVSSSGARSEISAYNPADGSLLYRHALPGPALSLLPLSGGDHFKVVVLDVSSASSHCTLLEFRGPVCLRQQALSQEVYAVRSQGQMLCVHTQAATLLVGPQGQTLATIAIQGLVISESWNPYHGRYAWLEVVGRKTYFCSGRVASQKERRPDWSANSTSLDIHLTA